jgi:hypothetical protein
LVEPVCCTKTGIGQTTGEHHFQIPPDSEDATMPRFLIEVPHEEEIVACAHVVEIFLKTGSHFLSNADWGCKDGVHKAWIIVDVDSKNDAMAIFRLPPAGHRRAAQQVHLGGNRGYPAASQELGSFTVHHRKNMQT